MRRIIWEKTEKQKKRSREIIHAKVMRNAYFTTEIEE